MMKQAISMNDHSNFKKNNDEQGRRGSSLIIVIIFTFISFLLLQGFLPLLVSDYRGSTLHLHKNIAFYVAEAGAEEALWALNNVGDGDWSTAGWTQATDSEGEVYWINEIDFKTETFNLENDFSAKIRVVVEEPVAGSPTTVYSEGIIFNGNGEEVMNDIIQVQAKSPVIFEGLIARNQITFNGRPTFASYDSTVHSVFPVAGINTGADIHLDSWGNTDWDAVPFFVGSVSTAAATVDIGNATVAGSIATGQNPVSDAIAGNNYSVTGQVVGGYQAHFQNVTAPDTTGWLTSF